MLEEFVLSEKYRPRRVADTILPPDLKAMFQAMVDKREVPPLLLTGGPGVGKTTVAMAMLDEIGADYIVINGSEKNGIDVLRNEITAFASAVSFTGGRKFVIIDESDYLNPNSTQPALRNFMQTFSKNCGFIMTCNFKNRLIEPLRSRMTVIDFKIPRKLAPQMATEFFKRVCSILDQENIEYEKPVVAELIKKRFPDFRKVLDELQAYSMTGRVDTGILTSAADSEIAPLIGFLKDKKFSDIRKWIAENTDVDPNTLFRSLYEKLESRLVPASFARVILILADYQYKSAFVVDQEINTAACTLEIMADAVWKEADA